jgi:hypothetical protein
MSAGHIHGPSFDCLVNGLVAFGGGVDSSLVVVPRDRFGRLAVAQLGQGAPFGGVVLAAVLD